MRIVRVTVLGLSCTLGLIVLVLMPDLVWYVPSRIRDNWALAVAFSCLMAYAIASRLAATEPEGRTLGAWAGAGLKRLDTCTDWVLRRGMALAFGVLCLGLLLVWVPHYLVWPWARDHETFAVLAQSWEEGILPYRDIRAYNFPGAIYIAWVLGKVFGWGHTVPLHAFDAGCVVLLGLVLAVWSRRRLGGAIPGLIGYLAFLAYYLGQPFDIVAQRDWHTALLVCLGLLVMQARPGRSTRLASALAAALALTIRPHAVLFLPALAWEAAQEVDARAPGRFRGIRGVAVWCLWFGIFVAMASAPLLLAGIADDLVRGLRIAAYGGPYSRATAANAAPFVRRAVRVMENRRSPDRDLVAGGPSAKQVDRNSENLVGGVAGCALVPADPPRTSLLPLPSHRSGELDRLGVCRFLATLITTISPARARSGHLAARV